MNLGFFMPRGLYCLLMTYDPSSDDADTPLNIPQFVHSSIKSSTSNVKIKSLGMNASRSIELPESAPLIFPGSWRPTIPPVSLDSKVFLKLLRSKSTGKICQIKTSKASSSHGSCRANTCGPTILAGCASNRSSFGREYGWCSRRQRTQ